MCTAYKILKEKSGMSGTDCHRPYRFYHFSYKNRR